jgi:DNA-directed RNA polymerase subunit RPC12/RpoP
MMQKTFSPVAAQKAQAEYCQKHNAPHFAPLDGVCFRCKKNIYQENGIPGYTTGISHEEATSTLVIYCPHCNLSYCD